jgi:hypothetical protein
MGFEVIIASVTRLRQFGCDAVLTAWWRGNKVSEGVVASIFRVVFIYFLMQEPK